MNTSVLTGTNTSPSSLSPLLSAQWSNDTSHHLTTNTTRPSTTTTMSLLDHEAYFESRIAIIVPVTFSVIALFGVIGNLVVIAVIAVNHRQPKNMTNMLIVSLAVADLLFITICIPFTAFRYAMHVWPFGVAWCKIYHYVANVTAYTSVYTLVLMSLDRFLAVVYPIASMTIRTDRNTFIAIGLNWAFFCACNLHIWWEYEPSNYEHGGERRSECLNTRIFAQSKRDEKLHGRILYGCFFVFAYLLPLVVICVLYGCILHKLTRHPVPGIGRESVERTRSRRRVTRMVVVIVLAFTICWLPNHVVFIAQFYGNVTNSKALISLQAVANCFAYLNSCIDPFLYAFLSDGFRGWFHRLLGYASSRRAPQMALLDERRRGQVSTVAEGSRPTGRRRQYDDYDDGLLNTVTQQTMQQSVKL